jgi:hypothetical protein
LDSRAPKNKLEVMRLVQVVQNRFQKMNMKKKSSKICEKSKIKLIFSKSFDIHFGGVRGLRERKIGKR